MTLVNVNVDQMQVLVMVNKGGMSDRCKCECKELIDKGICDKKIHLES